MNTVPLGVAAAAVGGVLIARRPWLYLGTTRAERDRVLPGDDVVASAKVLATRATTIDAPPARVWPWLVQMGHGRAGWYSYDYWDNAGATSVDRVVPELQHLTVGDVIADATGPFGFTVVRLEAQEALVFRATIHPITGKRVDPQRQTNQPFIDFTWAFVLVPLDNDRTRLLIRVRYDHTPRRWVARAVDAYELVDAVFTRKMLAGIRQRAEDLVFGQPAGTSSPVEGDVVPSTDDGDPPPRSASHAGGRAMEAIPEPMRRTRVAEVMTPDPIVLKEQNSVRLGGLTLLRQGISAAPVTALDGRLVGVFSHSDVLARFAAPRTRRGPIARLDDRRAQAQTVGEACTRPPAIIGPDATVETAARELLDRDIGRLVVVDNGKVIGVISRSDVLKQFLPTTPETADRTSLSRMSSD